MKALFTLLLMTTFLFSRSQSFELSPSGNDTINLIDANGKKQGLWIIRGYLKKGSCYQLQQKIEEGLYKDNKRVGLWKEYHCNSNLKSKINYIDGRPSGAITFYFENETVREEGTWSNNRWVGKYRSINDNGDITEIVFDDKGKEVSKKMTPAKKAVTSKKK